MSTFRTFVNAFGINPSSILWPLQNIDVVKAPLGLISQWYWCLQRLIFTYSYVINDLPIQRTFVVDGSRFTLKERIHGGWIFESPKCIDSELEIETYCKLYLCQVYDFDLQADIPATKQRHDRLLEASPLLCRDPALPRDKYGGLELQFRETALNGDFSLHTIHQNMLGTCLHSITTPFMQQQVPIYLSSPYPDEIAGHISTFTIREEVESY